MNGPVPLARVTLAVDEGLMERARNAAHALGISGAAFLVEAVRQHVEAVEQQHGGPYPQRPLMPKPFAGHVREATQTPAMVSFNPVCYRPGQQLEGRP